MILADKIIEERKKNGWSQEELAEKLNVTRQSVSKWEGAQSVPDLQRILEMSRLFGVSTDYLLKDELEPAARTEAGDDAADTPLRLVSMEEAQAFLQLKRKNAVTVALATFLCVFGAVLLILCGGLSEYGVLPLGENVAAGLGMILLLVCAAVAVALFIRCAQRLRPFAFLEEEEFETAYGVRGLLRGVRPATVGLLLAATYAFAGMSVWRQSPEGFSVSALGGVLFCVDTLPRSRYNKSK